VVLVVIGATVYNNAGHGGGVASDSIANLNDKLIKMDEATSFKLNELNDRVTHISTRVAKLEGDVAGAAGTLGAIDLRALNASKQALIASKQALEAGSVAEAAYLSALNFSKIVPNLNLRVETIERPLNNS